MKSLNKRVRVTFSGARQKGFTLIELLIVVAIVGLLAAVGVPQYTNHLDRSSVSACMTELSAYRTDALTTSMFEDTDTDPPTFPFQACDIAEGDYGELAAAFQANGEEGSAYSVSTSRVENGIEIHSDGTIRRAES